MITTRPNQWPSRRRALRQAEWHLATLLGQAVETGLQSWLDSLNKDPAQAKDIALLIQHYGELSRKACGLPPDASAIPPEGDPISLPGRLEHALKKAYATPTTQTTP